MGNTSLRALARCAGGGEGDLAAAWVLLPRLLTWLHLEGGATGTFVVECYWPGISEEQVRETLSRLGPSPKHGDPSDSVHSFGCILVPSDGLALFLFRGASQDLVRDRSETAEVPFDRIVESIYIGVSG